MSFVHVFATLFVEANKANFLNRQILWIAKQVWIAKRVWLIRRHFVLISPVKLILFDFDLLSLFLFFSFLYHLCVCSCSFLLASFWIQRAVLKIICKFFPPKSVTGLYTAWFVEWHWKMKKILHRGLLRSRQQGGLVMVFRLGVPLRCKAIKLKYPLRILPLVKKKHLFDSS